MLIWALRVGTVSTLQGCDGHADPISGRRHRLCLYHYNTFVGDDRGGERSTSIEYNKKKPPVAAPDHHHDCNCFGLDGRACS